jgi:hypothetical protein
MKPTTLSIVSLPCRIGVRIQFGVRLEGSIQDEFIVTEL